MTLETYFRIESGAGAGMKSAYFQSKELNVRFFYFRDGFFTKDDYKSLIHYEPLETYRNTPPIVAAEQQLKCLLCRLDEPHTTSLHRSLIVQRNGFLSQDLRTNRRVLILDYAKAYATYRNRNDAWTVAQEYNQDFTDVNSLFPGNICFFCRKKASHTLFTHTELSRNTCL